MKKHYPLIRTIYLYLFTLVGLSLVVIGAVRFVDMGLKAFVFTKAEDQQKIYDTRPVMPYGEDGIEELEQIGEDEESAEKLSESDIQLIKQWLEDYEQWEEQNDQFDSIASARHRDAASSLSFIIVGLPLFLYHWRIIRRETK